MLAFCLFIFLFYSQTWWLMPVLTALGRWKQGDPEFSVMLSSVVSLRAAWAATDLVSKIEDWNWSSVTRGLGSSAQSLGGVRSPALHKRGAVVHTSKPSTVPVESGGSKVQSYS